MATVGEAIASTLIAQWTAAGGAQPDPIQYLVERPERDPNPTVADAVYVWLPLRRKFDPVDVAGTYRNVTYTIRVVCHTKTSSARQKEIENEVDRILNSGTVITGATKQTVKEINDISNRTYSVLPKYISEVIVEVFTAMEVSATAYGTGTTSTFETDELTVNTHITGLGLTITSFKDEDDMVSDDAAALCSQQSIKKYVDDVILTEDTLAEMNDVTISAPADNEFLAYDNASSKWKNQTRAEASIADSDIDHDALANFAANEHFLKTAIGIDDLDDTTLTGALLEDLLMFGSANAAFVPCPFETMGASGMQIKAYIDPTSQALTNTDAQTMSFYFRCPKPTVKGGLKLYVDDMRIGVQDADATNYVTAVYIYGMNYTGATEINVSGTNRTSANTYTYAFAAVDASSYDSVLVRVLVVTADAAALDLTSVELLCYYAA